MRKYEIMYIIRPTLDDTKGLVKEINEIFPKFDSKVVKTDEMGMKELAYEIEKHTKGTYVLLNVEATVEAVDEFERICRIKEDIIRFIVLKSN